MRSAHSKAKRSEYGKTKKYLIFTDKEENKASVNLNRDAVENDLRLAGYNLFAVSESGMPDKDVYDVYHNLRLMKESFRIMKSDLDARLVSLQKEDMIKGRFFICYLTVFLERFFRFKVLKD